VLLPDVAHADDAEADFARTIFFEWPEHDSTSKVQALMLVTASIFDNNLF
jgi:hypothetical protein